MDDDAWGDDDMLHSAGLDGDGAADWRTVLLRDAKLGRTIECFVDREIEVDGKQYATLMPADTPVIMAGYKEVNGSQNLVPVLDDTAIDELFPTAFAVLSEMDLTLSRSAVVLTVRANIGARLTVGPATVLAEAVFLLVSARSSRWRRWATGVCRIPRTRTRTIWQMSL
jgi:hypothetical protein